MPDDDNDKLGFLSRLRGLLPGRLAGRPVVPVVRLHGTIGAVTPLRPGMSLGSVSRMLEKEIGRAHV